MNRLINQAEYCVEPECALAEIPRAVRMVLFCTAGSMDWHVIGVHGGVPSADVTETLAPGAMHQE